MQFYCYRGRAALGCEQLGTEGRAILRDLKTVSGAIRRARRFFGPQFRLYSFTNFYDDCTFREVKTM